MVKMSEVLSFCNQQILFLSGSSKRVQGQVTTAKVIIGELFELFSDAVHQEANQLVCLVCVVWDSHLVIKSWLCLLDVISSFCSTRDCTGMRSFRYQVQKYPKETQPTSEETLQYCYPLQWLTNTWDCTRMRNSLTRHSKCAKWISLASHQTGQQIKILLRF